jgi:hypothetical protein
VLSPGSLPHVDLDLGRRVARNVAGPAHREEQGRAGLRCETCRVEGQLEAIR